MLKKDLIIAKINCWNNSFQNMYGMNRQQLTVWSGKSILCQKTPHFRLFWWAQIWVTWLWKDLDAKRLTPGQLLGWPWKLWGITLQTSCRWHPNWAHMSRYICLVCVHGNSRRGDFLGKTLFYLKIFNRKIFRGCYFWNPYTLRIQEMESVWVTEPPFRIYSGSKWGLRLKTGIVTPPIFVGKVWNE